MDASDLVREIRLVKSPGEIEYMRTAGALCNAVRDEALRLSVPGTSEGDIRAAMHKVIWSGDGDTPAHVWPMGAGDKARWFAITVVPAELARMIRCFTNSAHRFATTIAR